MLCPFRCMRGKYHELCILSVHCRFVIILWSCLLVLLSYRTRYVGNSPAFPIRLRFFFVFVLPVAQSVTT